MMRTFVWTGGALVGLALSALGITALAESGPPRAQSSHGTGGIADRQAALDPREDKASSRQSPDIPALLEGPPSEQQVSLVKLLANPIEYDGARVVVVGYLTLEHEEAALYLHREDYESFLVTNAVRVALMADQIIGDYRNSFRRPCYVKIEGYYHAPEARARIPFGGLLRPVIRLEPWRGRHLGASETVSNCE